MRVVPVGVKSTRLFTDKLVYSNTTLCPLGERREHCDDYVTLEVRRSAQQHVPIGTDVMGVMTPVPRRGSVSGTHAHADVSPHTPKSISLHVLAYRNDAGGNVEEHSQNVHCIQRVLE